MSKRKTDSPGDGHKLKRANTMDTTEKEGLEFIGAKPDFERAGPETRSKKEARETVTNLITKPKRGEKKEYTPEKLKMVFRLFDKDKDGHLSKDELADMLRSLGKRPLKRKIDQIMADLDADKNGTIEQKEWIEWFMKKSSSPASSSASISNITNPPSLAATSAATSAASTTASSTSASSAPTTSSSATTSAPTRSAPTRSSSSISDFYTEHAGLHEAETAGLDTFSNPAGRNFDLGREGAFNNFTIGILKMYPVPMTSCINSLRNKGFKVTIHESEAPFLAEISQFEEVWIISGNQVPSAALLPAIKAHHEAGKGLIIWADNSPYYTHANKVLEDLCSLSLTGSTPGGKLLKVGDGTRAGEFARGHILLTGIVNIHEGNTICYPSSDAKHAEKPWNLLATSTDSKPCMLTVEPSADKSWGRIVVDCGFTKLYDTNWASTAGTERYVLNAAVWVLNLENRVAHLNAPKQSEEYREMARGEHFELEGEMGKIMMGLGWNSPFDLDASVVLYDKNKVALETVSFQNLRSTKYGIKHSGDIINGQSNRKVGDDEQIDVDLTALGPEVTSLIFVVTVFSFGKSFKEVKDAYARLVDKATNIEKVRFTLTDLGEKNALVMCKVYRTEAGTWRMLTIGDPIEGRMARDMATAKAFDKYLESDYSSDRSVDTRLT